MKYILIFPLLAFSLIGCCQDKQSKNTVMKNKQAEASCTDNCTDHCGEKPLTCKLTTPEMQHRKETVVANLKRQVLEKKELTNGYSYTFKGSDAVVDEVSNFIKTERLCCDFFNFELKVAGDASHAWLTITGPDGTKDFITSELDL